MWTADTRELPSGAAIATGPLQSEKGHSRLSTRRISSEGRTFNEAARLKIVLSEGLFSPRSNCPM